MAGDTHFSAGFAKLKTSDHYKSFEEACSSATDHSNAKNMTVTTNDVDKPKGIMKTVQSLSPTSAKEQTTTINLAETTSSIDKAKPTPKSGSTNTILVNPKQKGNPVLKSITNVPWEFDDGIIPDYVLGRTSCALYLSLRYHSLKPDYLSERLKELGKLYDLRVLLVLVDTKAPHHALKHLTRICLLADLTLMLAWSIEEASKIIETYKIFEHKPPDLIMEKQDNDRQAKLVYALTSIRSVNKSDAANLLSVFGSLKKILNAPPEAIALCPGFSSNKAERLHKALHKPFLKSRNATKPKPVKFGIARFLLSSD